MGVSLADDVLRTGPVPEETSVVYATRPDDPQPELKSPVLDGPGGGEASLEAWFEDLGTSAPTQAKSFSPADLLGWSFVGHWLPEGSLPNTESNGDSAPPGVPKRLG